MDNDKLIEKLNSIEVSLAEIKQEIKFKNTQCIYHIDRINKIEKTVYGNGSPGIRTQVFVLWGAFLIIGTIIIGMLK